ncbi:acyltransferase family protein [Actinomadura sp. SCN-SB]|uniref:acyltransferase family protein n=1 Tax=Actinomadura sp. SCN-SB TaxID=3373092 RepID=UPI003753C78F
MKTGHPTPSASSPPVLSAPLPDAPAAAPRLEWLDALRGIAALVVAFHHGSSEYLPRFRHEILRFIDPGDCGVLLFFLVSGYIIPASLERAGSVRRFWIGRVFRIYPLLLLVLAVMLLLDRAGLKPLRAGTLASYDPSAAVAAHLTMMQDLLAVPNAINVLWTLSYEMVFYLLVVALFALGRLDRHSATIATALSVGALTVAAVLPAAALSGRFGVTPVALTAAGIMALAIGLACASRPWLWRTGAALGGLLAAVLVLGNSRVPVWQGLGLLAVMFAGTAIHRAERGHLSVRAAAVAVTAVAAALIGGGLWHIEVYAPGQTEEVLQRSWVIGIAVAGLAFAAGMALRNRRLPRWLLRLGLISYSVYLVHPVVLTIFNIALGRPSTDTPLMLVPYLVAVLVISNVTYRYAEAPCQRFGRRLARRQRVRPGSPAGNRA